MKFQVTFKTIKTHAILDTLEEVLIPAILGSSEEEALRNYQIEKLEDFTKKWVRLSEYIMVEFDTETNTATVVERSVKP